MRERDITGGAIETGECGKEEEGNWKKETDNLHRWIPGVDSRSRVRQGYHEDGYRVIPELCLEDSYQEQRESHDKEDDI